MPKKLGGLVCDNDSCRKFCDYALEESIKEWTITTVNIPVGPPLMVRSVYKYFCSTSCASTGSSND
jgi:hypothetical protein